MVRFVGVSLIYPNSTRALSDVNLHVAKGEFVFITGASGSGKSSLLQLVYRDCEPTEGSVVVAGQDVAAMDRSRVPYLRRRIGIVFQDFRLLPQLNVRENVGYALDVVGASRREKSRKVPVALELVGLGHKSDVHPHELSGGEQQRVSIARALVNAPPLLLADEPTGNLDPETSWEIVQLLGNISDRGTTVVVATHDKYIVDGMRKRVVALAHGVVIRDDAGGAYDYA